jgi:hypothetical protein
LELAAGMARAAPCLRLACGRSAPWSDLPTLTVPLAGPPKKARLRALSGAGVRPGLRAPSSFRAPRNFVAPSRGRASGATFSCDRSLRAAIYTLRSFSGRGVTAHGAWPKRSRGSSANEHSRSRTSSGGSGGRAARTEQKCLAPRCVGQLSLDGRCAPFPLPRINRLGMRIPGGLFPVDSQTPDASPI